MKKLLSITELKLLEKVLLEILLGVSFPNPSAKKPTAFLDKVLPVKLFADVFMYIPCCAFKSMVLLVKAFLFEDVILIPSTVLFRNELLFHIFPLEETISAPHRFLSAKLFSKLFEFDEENENPVCVLFSAALFVILDEFEDKKTYQLVLFLAIFPTKTEPCVEVERKPYELLFPVFEERLL